MSLFPQQQILRVRPSSEYNPFLHRRTHIGEEERQRPVRPRWPSGLAQTVVLRCAGLARCSADTLAGDSGRRGQGATDVQLVHEGNVVGIARKKDEPVVRGANERREIVRAPLRTDNATGETSVGR